LLHPRGERATTYSIGFFVAIEPVNIYFFSFFSVFTHVF
jgi:hypothetical protein